MNETVITGSTGAIGRRAVRELLAAGYRVTGVTRSAPGRERLESLGARAVEADVFDEASLRRAFAGADAVVNLLTHIPTADHMADPSAWEENDRLRTEASAAIARAAQAARVQRLVQESIAFVYADGGNAWLDEDAPVAGGGVTTTALTAERNVRELFDGDTVVLRFGLFMGPDSGSTLGALEAARGGTSIAVGPPDAYRPTLWLDDAARPLPRRCAPRPARTTSPTPTRRRTPRSMPRWPPPWGWKPCARGRRRTDPQNASPITADH
jgi:UDP-glucose 4-epimerase